MQICPQCSINVLEDEKECTSCGFLLEKVICPGCSAVLDSGADICDSCGQYLNRELIIITSDKLSDDQLINNRYLVLDKTLNIVKDNKPNYQTFSSGILNDEILLDKYKALSKYSEVPHLYDAFTSEGKDYILIRPVKDNYGQDLRTINEAWVDLTEREKLQILRVWANLYQDFEKHKVLSSIFDLYNICIDENINIKLKDLKSDSESSLNLKNLGQTWASLLLNPNMSFLEYSKYKIGEIVKNINDNKINDISELLKKLDNLLENPVTEVTHAAGTHPGRRRTNNEDNFYASTTDFRESGINITYRGKRGLYIVCDGMGGHESGEVASAKAISEIKHAVLPALCFSLGYDEIKQLLEKAIIHNANEAIFQLNEAQHRKLEKRMGTTLVMSLVVDDKIYMAHVGDSRAFLVTKNGIEQVTEDHNVAMKNYRDGVGSLEDAMNTANTVWGKVLTQALGPRGEDSIEPDINVLVLKEESYLLLSSDGLTDMVKSEKIQQIVKENWHDPKAVVNKLIEEANNNGGRDNITVLSVLLKPMPSIFPPHDYAEIFFNNELKMNDEIVEMVETNEKALEGINVDPDS